jgi:hypothetical protein
MDAVRAGKRPDISPNCPPTFRSLIQRCWQHDPSRRYVCMYVCVCVYVYVYVYVYNVYIFAGSTSHPAGPVCITPSLYATYKCNVFLSLSTYKPLLPINRPMFKYIVRYLKEELARVKRQKSLLAYNPSTGTY